jgi:hypothetical protein
MFFNKMVKLPGTCEAVTEGRQRYRCTSTLRGCQKEVGHQRHAPQENGSGTHCAGGWRVLGLVRMGPENLAFVGDRTQTCSFGTSVITIRDAIPC